MELVYDAGALIAADRRGNAQFTALHTQALNAGILPLVPAGALGQAWRDGARQTRLSLVLRGTRVVPLDEQDAKEAGTLCGRAGTADVVDASVVILAVRHHAGIVTSDHGDITKLIDTLNPHPRPRIYDV